MGWFLDRLVLHNTRHPLPPGELSREWLDVRRGRVELFQWTAPKVASGLAPLHVIKFIGAAGRAENMTIHPFDVWEHRTGTITAVNPPGFGQSPGRPKLDELVEVAQATVDRVRDGDATARILMTGNSLGGAVAICAASRELSGGRPPAGVIVRDAPNLQHVIRLRFGRTSAWLPARLLGRSVPRSLDVVSAARTCTVPAVIVTSQRDRVVPPAAQRSWIDHYSGPTRMIELPDAGHYDPMGGPAATQYRQALVWLESQIDR